MHEVDDLSPTFIGSAFVLQAPCVDHVGTILFLTMHEFLERLSFLVLRQPSESIAVITTGGTIDKVYFDALSAYRIGEPVVEKLFEVANVVHPYRVVELLRKDSLDLTDEDRATLQQTVGSLEATRIVITHGADSMTVSARVLSSITDKTIVLTGALSPARFSESDAAFNLGMAFASAQTLPAGVYVAMNGHVFRGDNVRRDRQRAAFVADGD